MRPLLLLPAALLLLSACAEVEQATDTAQRVQDCAALARDVLEVGLSGAPSAAEAQEAAERLAERAQQADTPEVRAAAETLQTRLQELAEAAGRADPAAAQQAAEAARTAAEDAARTCGLPVDQFLG